jgi:hypothetical protein
LADDDWAHTNKEWRETLEIARGLGWSCRKTSNHNIRYLECPDGVCRQPVYSTGNGTENVARGTRNKVRACPHRNITSPLASVNELLVHAERFLTAAEALMAQDLAENRMESALELAETADELIKEAERELEKVSSQVGEDEHLAAEVEHMLDEAMDKQERGQKVKTEASEAFDKAAEQRETSEYLVKETLRSDEVGIAPADLIREASSGLRRADLDLRELPQRNGDVVAMSERMVELKTKCESLRRRLPA